MGVRLVCVPRCGCTFRAVACTPNNKTNETNPHIDHWHTGNSSAEFGPEAYPSIQGMLPIRPLSLLST